MKAREGDIVTLTVTPENGKKLSSLSLSGGAVLNENVSASTLVYTFKMPAGLVTVSVTFRSESSGGGGGGGSSTTGRHAAQTNESVDVPDNDVPKAENPIVKAIEDVLVPLGILPKTGDNSTSIEIMSGITVMSAALLVLLIAKRRRKDA